MKKYTLWASVVVVITLIILFIYLAKKDVAVPPPQPISNTPVVNQPIATTTASLLYTNKKYKFSLSLLPDWQNYTIIETKIPFGTSITLRHSLWSGENTQADIPILIYPLAKWQEWEKKNFEGYPTAAPIGPTERERNSDYVFATAPRYNFNYAPGFEEVEEIIKTLKTL